MTRMQRRRLLRAKLRKEGLRYSRRHLNNDQLLEALLKREEEVDRLLREYAAITPYMRGTE